MAINGNQKIKLDQQKAEILCARFLDPFRKFYHYLGNKIDGRLWARFHLGKSNVFPLGPYIPSFTIAQK